MRYNTNPFSNGYKYKVKKNGLCAAYNIMLKEDYEKIDQGYQKIGNKKKKFNY